MQEKPGLQNTKHKQIHTQLHTSSHAHWQAQTPSHKDEIDYACIVEKVTFIREFIAAFSEILLMHHFSVLPLQSEKQSFSFFLPS